MKYIGIGLCLLGGYFLSWIWVSSLISYACHQYFKAREFYRRKMDAQVGEMLKREYHEV